MKFTIDDLRLTIATPRAPERGLSQSATHRIQIVNRQSSIVNERGFTMIEIALCLAIIGFALLAIIGVLPWGMHTQRDTRQETIINQDASMLLEAIRSGARGLDDLTNNVLAITNYITEYDKNGNVVRTFYGGYTYPTAYYDGATDNSMVITNGRHILGLLTTPEYTAGFKPIPNLFNGGYSNHVVAYIRSFSGLAAEKPPQDNPIMKEDTFSYRLLCVNAPMAADTNSLNKNSPFYSPYNNQLAGNLHELRLTFYWPLLPNSSLPANPARQTFRASVGGQVAQDPVFTNLYFYQSQSFTNTP
jgi:prepilin-type N-terminal cleavage/methylation domain-containing protein